MNIKHFQPLFCRIIMFLTSRHWFLLCLVTSVIAYSTAELDALLDFKTSTNPAVWDPANTWDFSGPGPCVNPWVGISCDPTSGQIYQIMLASKRIQGTIPASFSALTNLQSMLLFYFFLVV